MTYFNKSISAPIFHFYLIGPIFLDMLDLLFLQRRNTLHPIRSRTPNLLSVIIVQAITWNSNKQIMASKTQNIIFNLSL